MIKIIVPVFSAIVLLAGCVESLSRDTSIENSTTVSGVEKRLGVNVEADTPPTPRELNTPTQVVVLGTGTPIPDPYRAGSSIAVIHKGESYIFDIGAGSMQRAIEARVKYDIPALNPNSIRAVFLTHLHSDHIADLPILSGTMWWERSEKLKVFGPVGVMKLSEGIETFYEADINLRVNGIQPVKNPEFYKMNTTVIEPGIIYRKDDLTIEAFTVPHGSIKPAFGFKIVTDDKTIVISGDTSDSKIIIDKTVGADLLFHEVVSVEGYSTQKPSWQKYHKAAHTLSTEVAEIAKIAKPGTLILYHGLYFNAPEQSVINEIKRAGYTGKVVLANDLDRF